MKKVIRNILIIVGILIFLWLCLFVTDCIKADQFRSAPIFTLWKTEDEEMKSTTYHGLGYTIEMSGKYLPDVPKRGIKYVKIKLFGITLSISE